MSVIARVIGMILLELFRFVLRIAYVVFVYLLHNLPTLTALARQGTREFLRLSCQLYRPIMAYIQPYVEYYSGLSLEDVRIRSIFTILFSLLILSLFYLLTGWPFSLFGVALAIAHGLGVGTSWNATDQPADGLHLGEEIS